MGLADIEGILLDDYTPAIEAQHAAYERIEQAFQAEYAAQLAELAALSPQDRETLRLIAELTAEATELRHRCDLARRALAGETLYTAEEL